jgi:hypothetical protein
LANGKDTEGQLKGFFDQINVQLYEPPLSWGERDSIWKSALDFVHRINAIGEAKIQNVEKEEHGETGNSDLVVSLAEKIMRNHIFATMNDTGEIYLLFTYYKSSEETWATIWFSKYCKINFQCK